MQGERVLWLPRRNLSGQVQFTCGRGQSTGVGIREEARSQIAQDLVDGGLSLRFHSKTEALGKEVVSPDICLTRTALDAVQEQSVGRTGWS